MLLLKKLFSKSLVLAYDVFAIPVAWFLSYWLRYNLSPFYLPVKTVGFYEALLVLVAVQIIFYYHFKVYRGLWRFFSISDVIRILQAAVCTTLLLVPLYYGLSLLKVVPRSIFPLYCLILSTLLCGARFLRRHYWDNRYKTEAGSAPSRVLIIGAGQAGESLTRDLKRTQAYVPIGLIDDNPAKKGLDVHGVEVLGPLASLEKNVIKYRIDLIFIAIPSATSSMMRQIVEQCEQCNIQFRTLPSIQALASGRVDVNALREVHIEDLLGREQIRLHWDEISAEVQSKRVMVTGGGGSIGSELCRQIMSLKPKSLLILDNSEYNLYEIDLELRHKFPLIPIELALISVTDEFAIHQLMHHFRPEIVFHAAAFKHVPMLEHQVRAGVMNNIIGTELLAKASVACAVEKFILISTDKAVNPTNVMGATKRVAEIYCQNLNSRVNTQFITVRFGNVLDSVGSVVPLFKKQLKHGGPLTVTHPDMERYFMTISEACQLILQAMATGSGGEIFVLDMGAPVKINYLAYQMIKLAGKEPGADIQIQYTGLRPGEKLFEELFHISEELIETTHEKLFKARFRQMDWEQLSEAMVLFKTACASSQNNELKRMIKDLVPEFQADLMVEEVS